MSDVSVITDATYHHEPGDPNTTQTGIVWPGVAPDVLLRQEFGLLLPEELAPAVGVTPNTLAQWRAQKTGPVPTMLGKKVFYTIEDVQIWIARSKRPHVLTVMAA